MCSAPVQTLKNLKLHYAELSLNSSVLKNLKYSANQISSVMNSTKSDEKHITCFRHTLLFEVCQLY